MNLSTCPEAFLTLRAQFVKTHAALSVCQYILGIGDRHLSNFLVDQDTGGSVGIDFGHAFGTATQVSSQQRNEKHCACVDVFCLTKKY